MNQITTGIKRMRKLASTMKTLGVAARRMGLAPEHPKSGTLTTSGNGRRYIYDRNGTLWRLHADQ